MTVCITRRFFIVRIFEMRYTVCDMSLLSKRSNENTATKNDSATRGDVLDLLLSRAADETPFFAQQEVVHYEGQLAIDMIETNSDLVIVSTIAGADISTLSINIAGDVLTIRGRRDTPVAAKQHEYLYKECYWGWFSRTIVLPFDVKMDETGASFQQGVLTITLPKSNKITEVPIQVVEE